MEKQTIRDWRGKILGWIETDVNGDKRAKDFSGRIVGYYKKSTNVTTDWRHRIITKGDTLASLIPTNNNNK